MHTYSVLCVYNASPFPVEFAGERGDYSVAGVESTDKKGLLTTM